MYVCMYVCVCVLQPYAYEINAERLKTKVQEMDQANDRLLAYVCTYVCTVCMYVCMYVCNECYVLTRRLS